MSYIAGGDGPEPGNTELREFVRARLPDYMIPAAFTVLPAMPINRSGKVDRRALPAPVLAAAPGPRRNTGTATETALLGIWRDLLGNGDLGMDSSFFENEGHSLLGVQLLYQIEKRMGRTLPLAALFEASTPALRADLLDGPGRDKHRENIVAFRKEGRRTPFYCVLGHVEGLAPHLDLEQPVYMLYGGAGDRRLRYLSVENLAAEHIAAVREVQPRGPYRLGGFSFGALVAHEMARLLVQAGESLSLLALFDPGNPKLAESTGAAKRPKSTVRFPRALRRALATPQFLPTLKYFRLRRVGRWLNTLVYRGYLGLGLSVPPALRLSYNMYAYRLAAVSYRAQDSGGRIDAFRPEFGGPGHRADNVGASKGWDQLAAEGVEVHVVPGAHGHNSMLFEPCVQRLAVTLGQLLADRDRPTIVAGEATSYPSPVPPGRLRSG